MVEETIQVSRYVPHVVSYVRNIPVLYSQVCKMMEISDQDDQDTLIILLYFSDSKGKNGLIIAR